MDWISVKDKLPEEYRSVICYDDQSERIEKAEFSQGRFNVNSYDNEILINFVTHWQPLPEPPTEEKNNHVKGILDYLNDAKRKITGNEALRGFRDTPAVKAMINARLKEKYAVDDFKLVIDFKCLSWKDDKKMQEYIRPSTLFKASHFPEYLCEAEANINNPVPAQLLSESVKPETAQEIYNRMAEDARK